VVKRVQPISLLSHVARPRSEAELSTWVRGCDHGTSTRGRKARFCRRALMAPAILVWMHGEAYWGEPGMVPAAEPEQSVAHDVIVVEVYLVMRLEVVVAGIDLGLRRKRPVEGEVDFVAVLDMRDVFVAGFRPEVVGGVLVGVERY
jgi:hypothetical protein